MKLTTEQVLSKLAQGTGKYDDGDVPGWLSLDEDGTAVWQSDTESPVVQRFRVRVTETVDG